ncbi:hypothetical protein HYC85_018293 [Camellia sinensis]|uniref:Uncharacterized protein n=1 Tax=Camellia sinensis TaxID=4442 RepID=A0A7J7GXL7_CAMSI|nr:hypothetical protein HYC85_018293 [Camellia sinensis]
MATKCSTVSLSAEAEFFQRRVGFRGFRMYQYYKGKHDSQGTQSFGCSPKRPSIYETEEFVKLKIFITVRYYRVTRCIKVNLVSGAFLVREACNTLCMNRYVLNMKVPPNQPYYCPSMDAIEDSMYVPVSENRPYYLPCMDATQDSIYVPAPVSTIGDDIGSTSHTQAGMGNSISSQSSIVPSNFVDLNIDRGPNVPFFF